MYSLFLTTLFCWLFSTSADITAQQPYKGTQHVTVADIGVPKIFDAKVDAGTITIRGANSGFSCSYVAHNTDPSKTVKVNHNNGTLEVAFKKGRDEGWSFWSKKKIEEDTNAPKVDFDLALPKNCEITISLGGGLVQLTSLDGKIQVSSGAGRIKSNALSGKVHVNTGSGTVELHELQGDVHVNTGSGKIELSYADVKKDTPRKCTVKGGSASMVIKLPSSWCVKNKLRASIVSKVSNAFGDCAKKQRPDMVVYGGIGTGSVKIVKK